MPDPLAVDDTFATRLGAALTDPDRLAAVVATGLLDSAAEPGFDRLATFARHLLKAPFGFVTIVDDERSFWKASSGPSPGDARQTTVDESFCQYVIGTGAPFLVDDTTEHPMTRANPLVESMGVAAWAGAPVTTADGQILGTICVVDTQPRSWTEDDAAMLRMLAELVLGEIDSRSLGINADRSESLLNAVLERAPIGFGLVDAAMRYEMINDALADINGLPASEHFGRSIHTVLPDVADEVVPILERVLVTGEPAIGLEISGETAAMPGRRRHWLANFYRLDVGDGRPLAGMFVEDITATVQARQRAEALAEATAGFATADSLSQVGEVIATHATTYFGADFAVLGLVDRTDGSLTLLGNQVAVDASVGAVNVADAAPYGDAYRTGRLVFVGSSAERLDRYPDGLQTRLPIEATASVPCTTSSGNVMGVLVVAWFEPVAARDIPRAQLRTFADIVSQAIERTLIAEERDALVSTLQRDLTRTATAEHARLDLTVHYEPVNESIGFGGDWYDVIEIDEHRTALVVGDVTGHDADAAAHMTRIRTILATLIGVDTDLASLFVEAERLLRVDSHPLMASAAVVVIDHDLNTATTVCAGHPPPILVPADGGAVRIEHGLGPWIGAGCEVIDTPSVHFGPGAILALYTDGLIERRDHDIDSDIDRLVAFLDEGSFSADDCGTRTSQMVRRLIGEFLDDEFRADDVALIVACLRPPES